MHKDSIYLKSYFKDLRKIDLVDGNEQTELAVKAKAGDSKAKIKLMSILSRFYTQNAKNITSREEHE